MPASTRARDGVPMTAVPKSMAVGSTPSTGAAAGPLPLPAFSGTAASPRRFGRSTERVSKLQETTCASINAALHPPNNTLP
jgi:hypothetical protein